VTIAVAIMAKAPRVGEVKTRLVPPLSPSDAAALGAAFIQDVAGNILAAAQAAPIAGYVAYAPAGSEAVFRSLLPSAILLLPSRHPGLGASLYDAAEDLLGAGHEGVCLVNADSPNLPTGVLVEAARALQRAGDRLVLGPAEDGGYYLIGMKRPHQRLFEDIDWSTERVFRQTRDRAAELALETISLPAWYDVDDAVSLDRLSGALLRGTGAAGGYAAPHTTDCLRRVVAEDAAAAARGGG
jgi:rSAM/selenodomain-associated transferase 1